MASDSYDMHAASFDAATRDAQPGVPGEQPLLFVFAAGDASNGNDNGGGGAENSILSPGTAKNVITVGALDAARFITNEVTFGDQTTNNAPSTNAIFFPWTDNNDLVSWFSSCGNVGPGTETLSGRFKPDVVAPGMFIISCRASNYVDPSYSTQVTPYFFGGQIVLPGHTQHQLYPGAVELSGGHGGVDHRGDAQQPIARSVSAAAHSGGALAAAAGGAGHQLRARSKHQSIRGFDKQFGRSGLGFWRGQRQRPDTAGVV